VPALLLRPRSRDALGRGLHGVGPSVAGVLATRVVLSHAGPRRSAPSGSRGGVRNLEGSSSHERRGIPDTLLDRGRVRPRHVPDGNDAQLRKNPPRQRSARVRDGNPGVVPLRRRVVRGLARPRGAPAARCASGAGRRIHVADPDDVARDELRVLRRRSLEATPFGARVDHRQHAAEHPSALERPPRAPGGSSSDGLGSVAGRGAVALHGRRRRRSLWSSSSRWPSSAAGRAGSWFPACSRCRSGSR